MKRNVKENLKKAGIVGLKLSLVVGVIIFAFFLPFGVPAINVVIGGAGAFLLGEIIERVINLNGKEIVRLENQLREFRSALEQREQMNVDLKREFTEITSQVTILKTQLKSLESQNNKQSLAREDIENELADKQEEMYELRDNQEKLNVKLGKINIKFGRLFDKADRQEISQDELTEKLKSLTLKLRKMHA